MDITNLDDLRGFIKRKRNDLEINQQQLAERAGLTRQTISKFENGTDINASSLINIVRALDGRLQCVVESPDNTDDPMPNRRDFGM